MLRADERGLHLLQISVESDPFLQFLQKVVPLSAEICRSYTFCNFCRNCINLQKSKISAERCAPFCNFCINLKFLHKFKVYAISAESVPLSAESVPLSAEIYISAERSHLKGLKVSP